MGCRLGRYFCLLIHLSAYIRYSIFTDQLNIKQKLKNQNTMKLVLILKSLIALLTDKSEVYSSASQIRGMYSEGKRDFNGQDWVRSGN